jgi:hypothetical protein
LKDYYQILRISRHANVGEIKRAFRRLAVLFHPDKNPSRESLALFQEINEAHEVLSDPLKRVEYDQLLVRGFYVPPAAPQQWHRDPAYRRRQQAGYRPPPPGPSDRLLMMVHLLKYMRIVSFSGIAWCLFLVLDYALPFRVSEETVLSESNRTITWQLHHVPYVVVTDKGNQFPMPFEGVSFFPEGSKVKVVTSRILNILVRVEAKDGRYTIDSLATIYQNFLLAPIILLVLSMLGLLLKNGIEFRFNIEVSICIVMAFNLIFLLFSIL